MLRGFREREPTDRHPTTVVFGRFREYKHCTALNSVSRHLPVPLLAPSAPHSVCADSGKLTMTGGPNISNPSGGYVNMLCMVWKPCVGAMNAGYQWFGVRSGERRIPSNF